MGIRNILPLLLVLCFSSCIAPYIPLVNEPTYAELLQEGKRKYPDLFRSASETEKIGSPSVNIVFDETSDVRNGAYSNAEKEFSAAFNAAGFSVSNSGGEIKITGSFHAVEDSKTGFGGFIDCKAGYSIKVFYRENPVNRENIRKEYKLIEEFSGNARGLGLNPEDAVIASLENAGREAAKQIIKKITIFYRSRMIVRLEVYNLRNLEELNDFYIMLKTIKGINDAWLLDYRGSNAYFDVSSGSAGNLARGLMEKFGTSLKISRPAAMELEAVMQTK